jgi:uncharacterized protein
VVAALLRSDLRLPEPVYQLLSIYLLLAIGLKGGVELSQASVAEVWKPVVAGFALSSLIPLWVFVAARRPGGRTVPDAAALAAHYGSVSVVTYTAGTTFLINAGIAYEGFMPTLVAVMEVPAIVVALVLARSRTVSGGSGLRGALHEVVTGRSIMLLVGGLLIGVATGPEGFATVEPLFVGLFRGLLTLFLLEMGIVAAQRFADLGRSSLFIGTFALAVPVVNGAVGAVVGAAVGLSTGGTTLLAVLAASASYIAAPAAVRIALPEANPGLYLTSAVAVTFPFNLVVGIPLYHQLAVALT